MGKEKTHINKRDPTEETNLGYANWVPVKDALLTELGSPEIYIRLFLNMIKSYLYF